MVLPRVTTIPRKSQVGNKLTITCPSYITVGKKNTHMHTHILTHTHSLRLLDRELACLGYSVQQAAVGLPQCTGLFMIQLFLNSTGTFLVTTPHRHPSHTKHLSLHRRDILSLDSGHYAQIASSVSNFLTTLNSSSLDSSSNLSSIKFNVLSS